MRLIDADAIRVKAEYLENICGIVMIRAEDLARILNEQPTIPGDEKLVRCKDCKYWYFADNRIPCEQENVCGRNGIVVTPDWYCANGERKEERGSEVT